MSTGNFVWFDLMVDAPAVAHAYYAALFGWSIVEHCPEYRMISAAGAGIGGIAPSGGHAPNHWLPYVTVDDLHATLATVERLGGRVLLAATPIPGTGTFAIIADRQGASIGVIRLDNESPQTPAPKGANAISWSELQTTDVADALAFYREIFGWKSEPWDMGNGTTYHMVGASHNAGIMAGPKGVPPFWLVYVNVADADAAVAKSNGLGGKVVFGPHAMKDVGRFAILADPTGAAFAVMQSARQH
jgi:hypothetical protein